LPIYSILWNSIYKQDYNYWELVNEDYSWYKIASPHQYYSEQLWAAGDDTNGNTIIGKAAVEGTSWEYFSLQSYQGKCTAISIDPKHPDNVIVALEDKLLRTYDGGYNWETAGLSVQGITFTSIIINPVYTENIIVAGNNQTGISIYESTNDGNTWQLTSTNTTISGITSMAVRRDNDKITVLIGTMNKGVYIYNSTILSTKIVSSNLVEYNLYQNYPNPFNTTTKIKFTISAVGDTKFASPTNVILRVFDVLGNEIATLVNEEKPAGEYQVEFNPASSIRYPASGVYFYQLRAGSFIQTRKMLLIK
jgi:WD40 repeat protein